MNDIYDIDGIISYAMSHGVDISPSDRQQWKMFCCALKVLGYDEHTFVALSSGNERDSRQAWRAERHPQRYRNEEQAKGMIVALAKESGMDVKKFILLRHKERFASGSRSTQKPTTPRPAEQPAPVRPCEYIPSSAVDMMAVRCRETSLFAYLCKWFSPADVEQVFNNYRVGASKYENEQQGGRAVSFPYINVDGQCVDCKIFHIDPATGSRKTAPPLRTWTAKDGSTGQLPTTWAMAELKKSDLRAPWCNFGDHLLPTRPDAKVCIVESEKSAIILSLAYPDRLWIAVGSMQNLTPERFIPYRGRKVTIYPDRDGISAWSDKAKVLAKDYVVSIDTTITRCHGECKDDLADIVIRSLQGTQEAPAEPEPEHRTTPPPMPRRQQEAIAMWEELKDHNPELLEFEALLDLVPISVEPWTPDVFSNH